MSELALLRTTNATLEQLLEVHEEQFQRQFELIQEQQRELETRAREITAANETLAGTNAVLQEVLRALPGALLVADDQGLVRLFNEAASTLLGRPASELAGTPMAGIFGEAVTIESVSRVESLGGLFRAELNVVTGEGTLVPMFVSATLLRTPPEAHVALRLICVAIDVADRKRLEGELQQALKLEAVGRLAAGVAHEINTPTQFVGDSIRFVKDAVEDLTQLISKYRALHRLAAEQGLCREMIAEISRSEEKADLEYALKHVPRALARALEGLARVTTIVNSMRTFAHPDQSEMTEVDLNLGIQSTLVIAQNEYKYVAEVETDYGDIPFVICHGGDINQAILNIIINAAHAIADRVRGTEQKGRITVRTKRHGDAVVVSIADTGAGIPQKVWNRIFDPFFTTKEVGRGTGQGLTIARSVVVEKHRGELTFETGPSGTTFFLKLPINSGNLPQTVI